MKTLSINELTHISGGITSAMSQALATAALGALVGGVISSSFSIFNDWLKTQYAPASNCSKSKE